MFLPAVECGFHSLHVPFQSPSRLLALEVWRLQLWRSLGTVAGVVSDKKKPSYPFGWGVGGMSIL